jgi:CHAD domain-containing protein
VNCLEKYRSKLIREINRELRLVYVQPEESAVHDFRVGMKRLSALFYFLNSIEPGLDSKSLLKPYRVLYKSIGNIRDAHIAIKLLQSLEGIGSVELRAISSSLQSKIEQDYHLFQDISRASAQASVRMPTINSTGISERSILAHKPVILSRLLEQIQHSEEVMTAKRWHQKRILLKRYHHILEAFRFCPGHTQDESEIKQIRMLEQLLGDWHDRVITAELLQSQPGLDKHIDKVVATINSQDRLLLGSAKIYLRKFALWHAKRQNSEIG